MNPVFKVSKDFTFDSAHSLPHLPFEHKCHHLHGHTYGLTVTVAGALAHGAEWVQDYAEITAAVRPLLERLDHKNLNDVIPCATTAENLAVWIYRALRADLPLLSSVEIRETATSRVVYAP